LFFRNYYNNDDYQKRNFYYIAPGSEPVLLGKYRDNATILRNGNDDLTGEKPVDNNDFIETYMFDNGQVARSNPYIYYTTTTTGGRRRRRTNKKKSKRRKTKRRKSNRRR
jgi:hypothetical protein